MWPFTKRLKFDAPTVQRQAAMLIKSVTLPEVQPDWSLFAKKDRLWDVRAAILEGYNASAAVYACVEKRATLFSSVPWRAVRVTRDGDTEDLPDAHPLQKLLDRPNPDTSWLETMYTVSQQLDIAGNACLSEIKGGIRNEPTELWCLPFEYIKIKPGRERLIDLYEYQQHGPKQVIQGEDMIHLRLPNPNDPIFGMPVMMGACRAIDIDRESGNWQKASLQNRSTADIHVEVPAEMQSDQIDAVQAKLAERASGPENARKPIVTSGKINHLSRTAVEMDFVESRKAVWSEICAVFGLSMSDLGFTESVNLANAESMQRQLWKNTIIPRLELVKRQLDNQLAFEFGEDIRVVYDTSNVDALQENYTEKLSNAEALYRMGYSNQAINRRLELGFEDDELPEELDFSEPEQDDEPIDDEVKRLIKAVTYGSN